MPSYFLVLFFLFSLSLPFSSSPPPPLGPISHFEEKINKNQGIVWNQDHTSGGIEGGGKLHFTVFAISISISHQAIRLVFSPFRGLGKGNERRERERKREVCRRD